MARGFAVRRFAASAACRARFPRRPQLAHAALFDDEEARKRIAATNTRIDQLQKDLDDRVVQLERQLKSGALVDLANNVEGLKSDVAKIRGQIEVLTYELEQSQKRQRDLYVDLDARMRKLEGAPGPVTGDAAPADAAATGATAGVATAPAPAPVASTRRRAARVRCRARPVQARRIPGCDHRVHRLRQKQPEERVGAVRAILDRQRAFRAQGLQGGHCVAAAADAGVADQPQGAGSAAQRRVRAV